MGVIVGVRVMKEKSKVTKLKKRNICKLVIALKFLNVLTGWGLFGILHFRLEILFKHATLYT